MKYLVALSLISIAYAAKLDNVYLPPSSRGAAAGGAGLQVPSGPGQFQGGAASQYNAGASKSQQAEILRYDNEITPEGFHYAYETSDGTKAEQQGRVIPGAKEDEGSIQVQGSYSYVGDDGQTYSISYTADENGYHAEGAHLPTPPPIPEAILKSLELTAGNNGGKSVLLGYPARYDNGSLTKASYTADEYSYHAEGAHLISPPSIPEDILKSLKLTAGNNGAHYNSQRSSYDADKTGY